MKYRRYLTGTCRAIGLILPSFDAFELINFPRLGHLLGFFLTEYRRYLTGMYRAKRGFTTGSWLWFESG